MVNHKAVLYVLSPPLDEMFDAGAVAAKCESAGVAHGVARWRNLADQARKGAKTSQRLGMPLAVAKACRLAFAKRPLGGERYYETVGYHLVGLPDIYVARSRGNEWSAVMLMEEIANAMAEHGIETTLRDRRLALTLEQDYAADDFKFNPYGIVRVEA
ncbi:hypothetical protein [Bradyrhizobium liaoningense]|uniref:hypothetical protein n=1 Tax=Bradyrhizobium liaoningense TaxID=43992 RepID=UPI00201193FB|nr:hypothetical protein [Bradyrhizobium liaoningense]